METHHRRHHSSSSGQKVYLPQVRSVPNSRKRPHPDSIDRKQREHSSGSASKSSSVTNKEEHDDMFTVTPEQFQLARKKLQLEKEGGGSGIPIPVVPTTRRSSTGSLPLSSSENRPPLTLRSIKNDQPIIPPSRGRGSNVSTASSTDILGGTTTEQIDPDTQRLLKFFGCVVIRRAATLLKVYPFPPSILSFCFFSHQSSSCSSFSCFPAFCCCNYFLSQKNTEGRKTR